MPRQFIPKQSGPHRIACIALYRALLFQCSRIELPNESFRGPINPIKYWIRKQFRRNQHELSASLVVAALKVGYEAEELLRTTGDGDKNAYSKVLSLLRDLQSQGDADRTRLALNPAPPKPPFRKPAPYPDAPKVLESRPRPLSELSGPRHVPILTAANGLPFLRFKKPQSPFLSRVLRDKINQRQKLLDHAKRLESDVVWAADEDEWEQLVAGKDAPRDRVSFEREMTRAKKEPEKKFIEVQVRATELAKRMLKIVDEEKRLFEEERIQRQKEKSRKRRERRESRESSKDSNELTASGEPYVESKPMSSDS